MEKAVVDTADLSEVAAALQASRGGELKLRGTSSRHTFAGVAEADPVEIAVLWILKAQSGSLQWTNNVTLEQIKYVRIKKSLKGFTSTAKWLLLGLAIFETPSYCLLDSSKCHRHGMFTTGLPILAPSVTNSIAICIWTYLALYQYVRIKSLGDTQTRDFHGLSWRSVGCVLLAVALLDCLVAVVNSAGLLYWSTFRLSRVFRPVVFLCFTKNLRDTASRVLWSIPMFADALLSLFICVFFFAWIGLVLFAQSQEGEEYFHTWSEAVAALWILFTTANCPDVFVLAYQRHPSSSIFFIFFIIISIYLLSNILLAAIYDAYKAQLKIMVKIFFQNQRIAEEYAYDLLATRGSVNKAQFTDFFMRLCDPYSARLSHDNDEYNKQRAEGLFNSLDTDHSGLLDRKEFKAIIDVMHHADFYIPRAKPVENTNVVWKSAEGVLTSGFSICGIKIQWDSFEDSIICIDACLVLVVTSTFVNGTGKFNNGSLDTDHLSFWILASFSFFYGISTSMKLVVFGIERFWNHDRWRHRFELINVYSICVAEIYCVYVSWSPISGRGHASNWIARLVLILHITRSLRLLHHIKPLKFLGRLVIRLAPTYYRMGCLMLLCYYVFAMIGVQAFGGEIYKGNPVLQGTDFSAANYWTINFNDFCASFVTLFVLMVVNNWTVITSACVLVTSKVAVIYFVSFFIVTNLVILNILMALILDCSGGLRDELDAEGQQQDDAEKGRSSSEYQGQTYEEMIRNLLMDDKDVNTSSSSEGSDSTDEKETEPLLAATRAATSGGGYGAATLDDENEVQRAGLSSCPEP